MNRRILIVDDDRKTAELVGSIWSAMATGRCSRTTAAKPLELARQKRPDLIVLDLMLPIVDGLDVYPAGRVTYPDYYAHGSDDRGRQAVGPRSRRRRLCD